MNMASLRCIVLGCLVAGCAGGTTTVTVTGPRQPARDTNCDFQVFTALPGAGYREIGTIDYVPQHGGWIHSLAEFKTRIQPDVCGAGGDAALAMASGQRDYVKATVLKATGAPPPTTPDGGPSDADGCHYDAQCKGERVCVKGECTEPKKL